ncbi:MAG: autotransporter assembly complex family protein [Pseudomonadota bacterium]
MIAKLKTGIAGALVLAALWPTPGRAFELFGLQIFGGGDDPDRVELLDPLDYTVETEIAAERRLERALLRASDVWQRRDEPASGSAGLIVAAKADYRRLLATLYTEGYYAGAISILLNGREAGELTNTTELRGPVQVLIEVDPGPIYVFGQTDFRNTAPGFEIGERAGLDALRRNFVPGEVARADLIEDVGEEAVDGWRLKGHPLANVSERAVVADHANRTVDVEIELEAGPKARFARPRVRGSETVKPEFIRYMTGIRRGSRFTPKRIERARKRLTRLGVFNSVRIVEGQRVNENGFIGVTAEVQDRKPRRVGVGATLSTLDGLGLEAFWLHRNIGGRAERLRFDASIGGIGSVSSPEDYDYLAGVSYRIPGVFDPDMDLEIGASVEQIVLDLYRERSVSAYAGFERIFTDRLDGSIFLETSYSRVEDEAGLREFLTFSTPTELTFDKRDNPTDATRGYYLSGKGTPFYEVEFDNLGYRFALDSRGYLSFGEDRRTVIAARMEIGTVLGGELRELPPDQLFFAGGGGSVRGYGFRSIGTEVAGDTLGGRSLLELSGELRQRVTDNFGVVAFLDSGFVSTENLPFDGFDPLLGAGIGLRYNTSLGPLRFDIGAPLNPRPDDPSVAFYIGLGQAF